MRILVLGGTAESRALAAALGERADCEVVVSLAGRTHAPAASAGRTRVGGFGGSEGLARHLETEAFDLLIDATHPFAQAVSAHAAQAAEATGVRLIALRRPAWAPGAGDRWIHVPDVPAAAREAAALPGGGCVFVTTGHRDLAAYAADTGHGYLIRTIEPPAPPLPPRHTLLLDRGPYTREGEAALFARHDVRAVVAKNSGGEAAAAKLAAARDARIPVVMIDRPAPLIGIETVQTVTQAVGLITA